MKKAPKRYAVGGSIDGDPKNKTPEQWKKENESKNYKPVPYLNNTGSGSSISKYPSYYDTNKFDIQFNPQTNERSVIDKKTGQPVPFNSLKAEDVYSYTPPVNKTPINTVGSTAVIPTSNRTFLANDANGNTTYRDNTSGETYMLDRNGNKIEPLQRANGGSIHIPKSHEGRFTNWASEHGMSVAEATEHVLANKDKYEPHVVEMANFSRNFGGHKDGGIIMKKAPKRYNKGGMC